MPQPRQSQISVAPTTDDDIASLQLLQVAARHLQRFALFFAICNSAPAITRRIASFETANPDLSTLEIPVPNPNLRLLDILQNTLKQFADAHTNKYPAIVFVRGFEGWSGQYPDDAINGFFQELNLNRNAITRAVPCPLVLWCDRGNFVRIQSIAPDFASIRTDVLLFSADVPVNDSLALSIASPDQYTLAGMPPLERQNRLKELLSRLERVRDDPDTSANNYTVISLLRAISQLNYIDGQYNNAQLIGEEILHHSESVAGNDHIDMAVSLNNLAEIYRAQGWYDKAEPLFLQALDIREEVFGNDHPDTALSLNNLAVLYDSQGLYDKAEPLYRRALAINEKVLGNDHPQTAASLNNLAGLYQTQGLYDKAEPLYRRALAINEKVLGNDHPHTAVSLNNLAGLYEVHGLHDKAEPLYRRALAINEKVLGNDHPDMAVSLNNLAILRYYQGRFGEAETLLERSLVIQKASLGAGHPDTQMVQNTILMVRKAKVDAVDRTES